MRSAKQVKLRKNRAFIANELLFWLKIKNLTHGSKAYEYVILPFARENERYEIYEIWRAWDLLKEAHRRAPVPGPRWSIDNFTSVSIYTSSGVVV